MLKSAWQLAEMKDLLSKAQVLGKCVLFEAVRETVRQQLPYNAKIMYSTLSSTTTPVELLR